MSTGVESNVNQTVLKRFARGWVIGGLFFFAVILWLGFFFGSRFQEEEANRKATAMAMKLVETYYLTRAQWPASWSDFDQFTEEDRKKLISGRYLDWTGAMKELQQRVMIDFQFKPNEARIKDFKDFSAIKPFVATQGIQEAEEYHQLLDALRKVPTR